MVFGVRIVARFRYPTVVIERLVGKDIGPLREVQAHPSKVRAQQRFAEQIAPRLLGFA